MGFVIFIIMQIKSYKNNNLVIVYDKLTNLIVLATVTSVFTFDTTANSRFKQRTHLRICVF